MALSPSIPLPTPWTPALAGRICGAMNILASVPVSSLALARAEFGQVFAQLCSDKRILHSLDMRIQIYCVGLKLGMGEQLQNVRKPAKTSLIS